MCRWSGVGRSGWGLDELRGSAASPRRNGMDPPGPAAEAQSGLVSEHPARTCSYRSTSRRTNLFPDSSDDAALAARCHGTDVPAQIAAGTSAGGLVDACAAPGEDVGASSGQVN